MNNWYFNNFLFSTYVETNPDTCARAGKLIDWRLRKLDWEFWITTKLYVSVSLEIGRKRAKRDALMDITLLGAQPNAVPNRFDDNEQHFGHPS